MFRQLLKYGLALLCAVCVQGCALIDDDLSLCNTYRLQLLLEMETSLDLELETVLSAETDVRTRQLLRGYFSSIFSDHAHDIDIAFYNQHTDHRQKSIHEIMEANQKTYTFYLPVDNYHAIGIANTEENGLITVEDSLKSHTYRLLTPARDTLPSQRTGVFMVERALTIADTSYQKIDLTLHMVNCALALVIDTVEKPVRGIQAFVTGTADGMQVRDSVYTFVQPHTIIMDEIPDDSSPAAAPMRMMDTVTTTTPHYIFGSINMPSPDTPDADGSFCKVYVYVSLPNGTVTQTVLDLLEPLQAGQLKVIKAALKDDGEVQPSTPTEVGATVTLDWQQGGEHNIEL